MISAFILAYCKFLKTLEQDLALSKVIWALFDPQQQLDQIRTAIPGIPKPFGPIQSDLGLVRPAAAVGSDSNSNPRNPKTRDPRIPGSPENLISGIVMTRDPLDPRIPAAAITVPFSLFIFSRLMILNPIFRYKIKIISHIIKVGLCKISPSNRCFNYFKYNGWMEQKI